MTASINQLTSTEIEKATLPPGRRTLTLNDGGGLRLLIDSYGKAWRYRYSDNGRDVLLSFGTYPKVSLNEARARAADARAKIARGESPAQARRAARDQERTERDKTFGVVAHEYNESQAHLSAKTRERCLRMFRHSKALHGKTFAAIDRADVLRVCEALQNIGRTESAHRLKFYIAAVFRFAADSGYFKGANVAEGKTQRLRPAQSTHRPALTDPRAVGGLMRNIDSLASWGFDEFDRRLTPTVSRALQVLARTAVRPGELAGAEWSEFDLDGTRHRGQPTWVIPKRRMKMRDSNRTDHVVPLSRQAVEILREQHRLSGTGRFVFPNMRSDDRPMTGEALPAAMKALTYGGQHCPHGFRTTFKSLAQDVLKAERELVERQLAHKIGNDVEGAYDRSQRLEERRALLQQYSDLLDRLREHGDVGEV